MSLQIPSGGSYPRLIASLGRVVRSDGQHRWLTGTAPTGAGTPQSATCTVSGADNDATYAVRLRDTTPYGSGVDETVSVTTDGASSSAELQALLLAALQAIPGFGLFCIITGSGLVTTVTAKSGRSFSLTEVLDPGNDLAIANTAATTGPTFYFGRAVALGAPAYGNPVGNITPQVSLPSLSGAQATIVLDLATNNTAQAVSLPVTHVPYGGAGDSTPLTFTTSTTAALTIAALVAAAEARFPTADVAITTVDEVVTISFPAGDQVSTGPITDGTAVFSVVTTAGVLPQLGIVRDAGNVVSFDAYPGPSVPTSYHVGSGVPVAMKSNGGTTYAVAFTGSNLVFGDQVYVDTASSPVGAFTNVPSATTIPFGARFDGLDPNDSTLAHVAI